MTLANALALVGTLEVDAQGIVQIAPFDLPDLVGCHLKTLCAPCDWAAWSRSDGTHETCMPRLKGVTRIGCRGFRDGGFRVELFGAIAPSRVTAAISAETREAFLVSVLDASPHFISVVDAAHHQVFENQAYTRALGAGSDAGASESSFDQAVLVDGASYEIPEVVVLTSGESLRVETAKRRIRGPRGEAYVLNVSVDMTSRQLAERALADTRDRLENAVAAGRLGLWDWDVARKQMYFSPMWKWQLGFNDDEVENTFEAWQQLLHPDDRARMRDALSEHLGDQTQQLYRIEFRLRTKGGDWRWVACSAITSRDAQGRAVRLIGCNVDITETHQYEASLQATNAHLAHAAKLKDEFLANMSHELRTPLNAVLGQAEAMRDGLFGLITGEQREALELIDASGRHLLSLINDVLDVAKLEAGRLETHFEPVGLEALCHESLAMVRQRAATKGLVVEYTNDSGVEAIHGDGRRLKQVLINLLSNAIKFTDRGTVRLEVTLEGREVVLSVSDTGIGMDEAELGLLFEPFLQLESGLRRSHEGSGLGLALVKRLVEVHHGTVRVRSAKGQGSTFSVALPIDDSTLPAPEPTAESTAALLKTTLRSALIVDDNDFNVIPLRAFLRLRGVDVMVARGAEEAIHLIRERHPDVTFMDIQMPQVDGFEAMRRLRADRATADIAIIALTALAMVGDRENCFAAGADGYLSKPVRLREALELAERIVASKAALVAKAS